MNKIFERYQNFLKTHPVADFVHTVAVSMLISLFIYVVVAIPNQVEGQSMEPTFHDKELLITNKVIQWLGETDLGKELHYDYQRGDVIIFHKGDIDLIKRIIGVGGDKIRIENSSVYVNDSLLEESYLGAQTITRILPYGQSTLSEGETVTVPQGEYFVMGDNRDHSKDSRYADIGFVPRENVKGKVFLRYWPINVFGIIQKPSSFDSLNN